MSLNLSTKVACPTWNGERDSYSTYIFKLKAVALSSECSDVSNARKMATLITQTEYDALDKSSTDPVVREKIKLWKANEMMAGYFTLGQESQHGINAIQTTQNDDYPMGLVYLAIEKLDKKFNPKDTTAKVLMKTAVEAIQLKNADDYYSDVIAVMSQYDLKLTDKECLEIMITKTGNTTFVKEIRDELKKTNPSFEDTCNEISTLQNLTKLKIGSTQPQKQKEVSLSNQSGGNVGGNGGGNGGKKCSHCGNPHKRSECQKLKELLKKQGDCKYCGKKGHLNEECFKQFPHKKPKWLKLKSEKATEASTSNVEVTLASVGQDFH